MVNEIHRVGWKRIAKKEAMQEQGITFLDTRERYRKIIIAT